MLNTQEIRQAIVGWINNNPKAFQAALLSDKIFLSKYAQRITKVNGTYANVVALMGHVVQAYYSKTFTPFTDVTYKVKKMETFRQKVDFVLDPAEILGTIYADSFDEGKKPQDKSITKEMMVMVLAKILDDCDYLSVNGIFDPTKVGAAVPVFGASMDGLNQVLTDIVTTSQPYFIPGDAVTSNNILAQVTAFEKDIPTMAKPKVKQIFTSQEDAEEYQEAYDDAFGLRPSFDQSGATKTRFGKRELVGVPGLAKGTIYTTIDKNFLELVDVQENPAVITDVQVQDRIVKLLSEFSLGYNFAIDQYLFIHTADATKNLGLNDSAMNKLFYPNERKIS
ncbi:hypothetical protein A0O34_15035 [Chryseobacterium glaciei]|uniref:Capsid protein n=1 Tax=Chryseobacterium glaciei TaxID=1685010 RepID=A0A172XXL8_9FLAO|nr:hypothetical protein [Chryseobacterium glaciei]ANF51738.1 hypothetical protein A0O34_15035 [Chryseobacterium glaciei]